MLLCLTDLPQLTKHGLNVPNGFIGISRHCDTQLLSVFSNTQSLPIPKVTYFWLYFKYIFPYKFQSIIASTCGICCRSV